MHETTISWAKQKETEGGKPAPLHATAHKCLEREKDQDSDMHSHRQGYNTGRARGTFHGHRHAHGWAYENNNVKQLSVITAFSVKVGCMSMPVNLNEPNERDGDEN